MRSAIAAVVVAGMCGALATEVAEERRGATEGGAGAAAEERTDAWCDAMRAKTFARTQADLALYGRDGCREIEMAYRAYSKSGDVDNEHLQKLLEKFPKANRTGCAVMYAGQRSQGKDGGKWFRLAIEKFGDCMYGDGAQVGAYARFYLAALLEREGRKSEADAIRAELLKLYPDARTHRGRKMADLINSAK